MNLVLAAVLGYFIGGIPSGILICRAVAGVDPRDLGSGSSGATNVSRAIGKKWALVVLLLDVLKGFLPVAFLAPLFSGNTELARILVALGTVAGHVWTPYASFRGGKGIATAAGAMIALDWLAVLIAFGVWLIVFALFRRVSLASLAGALAVPSAMVSLGDRSLQMTIAGVSLAAFLVFTHRGNIQRLLTGRERPVT